jgi:hypothetical protein
MFMYMSPARRATAASSSRSGRPGAPTASLPLSVARRELFVLADDLFAGTRERVQLTHRDFDEPLVLLRLQRLRALEAEVERLRAQVPPAGAPLRALGRFVAPGSAHAVVDVVRALDAHQQAHRLDAITQTGVRARRVRRRAG